MLRPASGRVDKALSKVCKARLLNPRGRPLSSCQAEKDEDLARDSPAIVSTSQSWTNTGKMRTALSSSMKGTLQRKSLTIRSQTQSVLRSRHEMSAIHHRSEGVPLEQSSLNKSMPAIQLESRPSLAVKDLKQPAKEKREPRPEVVQSVSKPVQEKTSLSTILSKHYIFGNFSKSYVQKLISSMKLYKLPPNEIVFKYSPANFFVVVGGAVEVIQSGKNTKTLLPGDCYGEMEMINDAPRTAIIRTVEPSMFWGIDKPSFKPFLTAIKALDLSEKREFISSIEIFSELSNSQKDCLAAVLIPHEFANGHKIVKEGDVGDLLYIIREGTVVCSMKGVEIRRLGKGEFFGEQALLYGGTRAATIAADGPVKCVSINRKNFAEILNNYFPMIYLYTILNTFKKSAYMCHISHASVPRMIGYMSFKTLGTNKVAIARGTPRGQYLWIVLRGSLFFSESQKVVEFPSCIGDTDLMRPGKGCFEEDLRTSGSVVIAKLSRTDFLFSLGPTIRQINQDFQTFLSLRDVHLLHGLTVLALRELVIVVENIKYRNGEEIIEQNSSGDCFFIMKSGQAFIRRDGVRVRTITKGDFFGEMILLGDEIYSVSVIAMINVSCWVIKKSDFLHIMTPTIRQRLMARIELLEEEKVSVKNLVHVKLLGSGKNVNVHLVANRDRPKLYALKAIMKVKVDVKDNQSYSENSEDSKQTTPLFKTSKQLEEEAINRELLALRFELCKKAFIEKEMLLQVSHPFIAKLLAVNEDEERYNFLLEFVNGPTLHDVRTKVGVVADELARFYAATGILTLEYLHERNIMHRNFDLTNVMVDADGYPKLIDFALAKIVIGRTYTIVGPPHCVAPEAIRRRGYSHSADFFSLGVILYKFISGHFPFADDEVDPVRIYNQILKHNLVYPDDNDFSPSSQSFIERLLSADPKVRMEGGLEELKAHEWFKGLDWEKLIRRELPPPFIPHSQTLANEVAIARTNNFTVEMIKEIEAKIAESKTKKKEE